MDTKAKALHKEINNNLDIIKSSMDKQKVEIAAYHIRQSISKFLSGLEVEEVTNTRFQANIISVEVDEEDHTNGRLKVILKCDDIELLNLKGFRAILQVETEDRDYIDTSTAGQMSCGGNIKDVFK